MPSVNRPPLTWSTVTAMLATTAGWRYVLPRTRVPIRMRGTAAASAATRDPASSVGVSMGIGPSALGMKWSAIHAPSHPVASA
jgi:hypothetical protein